MLGPNLDICVRRTRGERARWFQVPGLGRSESGDRAHRRDLGRRCVDNIKAGRGGGYVDEERGVLAVTRKSSAGEVLIRNAGVHVVMVKSQYQGWKVRGGHAWGVKHAILNV